MSIKGDYKVLHVWNTAGVARYLAEYLYESGFDTIKDWEDQVLRLNRKGKIPSYLIFLKVVLKDVFS